VSEVRVDYERLKELELLTVLCYEQGRLSRCRCAELLGTSLIDLPSTIRVCKIAADNVQKEKLRRRKAKRRRAIDRSSGRDRRPQRGGMNDKL